MDAVGEDAEASGDDANLPEGTTEGDESAAPADPGLPTGTLTEPLDESAAPATPADGLPPNEPSASGPNSGS